MRKIAISVLILSSILSLCSSQVCNSVQGSGLTESQKQIILDKHNYYRDLVAKGGAAAAGGVTLAQANNMKKMVWDETLATVAQNFANTCPWKVHNAARTDQTLSYNSSDVYGYVGENMYFMRTTSSAGKVSFPANVDSWYNEITLFQPSWTNPYNFSSGTGHFTQVVWAETTRIGCGYTWEYNTTLSTTFAYVHYVVCDYAMGGNWIGDPMYLAGTPCSNCDSGMCDTTYPNLCLPAYGQLLIEQSNNGDQAPEQFEEIKSEPVSQIQINNQLENQESNQKNRKSHLKRNQ